MKLDGKMASARPVLDYRRINPQTFAPFFSPDKSFAIAYNGNLTNYHTTKTDLKKLGFKFETSSDTE